MRVCDTGSFSWSCNFKRKSPSRLPRGLPWPEDPEIGSCLVSNEASREGAGEVNQLEDSDGNRGGYIVPSLTRRN